MDTQKVAAEYRMSQWAQVIQARMDSGQYIIEKWISDKHENLTDKRRFTLELSEKGYEMMKIEAAFSEKFLQFFYRPLHQDEIKVFEEIVEKIAINLLRGLS